MKKFKDMEYKRPDIEALKKTVEEATKRVAEAKSYDDVKKAYFDVEAASSEAETLYSLAYVRNTIDTTDEYYDGEVTWLNEQFARMIPYSNAFDKALAESPFRGDFEAEYGKQLFKLLDASLLTSNEKIIQETIDDANTCQEYSKTAAQAKTEFRGKDANFYVLLKSMQSTDREERKEAFEKWAALYEEISPKLDEQYSELVKIRTSKAHKMGFSSFTDMAYIVRDRFDYTKDDAAAFRKQILETVTPAVAKIREKQKEHLGIDKLRFYDEALLFPEGNADPIGTRDELVEKAHKMYREMSPETGEFFDFMTEYDLFDLDSRPGKHLGGYMTHFSTYKAPFIFSNFNGTDEDVNVLTHEAGHAFQGYLAMRSIDVESLWASTSEINEIHSMSMEHFAYPWMEMFFGENSEKYIAQHLIGAISCIPYLVCVDEFQHRVYDKPEMSAMDRRSVWREIELKYMPWRDYDGNEFLEKGGFWMQKQHIFLYPFYYIDYALSQICAFQYYGRMKENREKAWNDYLKLCRAGGKMGYFDLLKEGNLLNPFESGTVEQAVGHVIAEIEKRY
jgi:M3 family oligoendopeptidase